MEQPKDNYFVALKLFLRDEEKLLITHDIFGAWDLPGGRFRKDEFDAPFESVIARKMKEELGESVQYQVTSKAPVVLFRVERLEHSSQQMVRIFALGYTAAYLGGEIVLGDHHDQMEWVDVNTFNPSDYFTGGWLAGVQEYQQLVRGAHS